MAKRKRYIKSVNVGNITSETTIKDIIGVPHFKDIIYDELYLGIKEAIDGDKETATLFEINYSGTIVELDKTQWETALKEAIVFYEKTEKYEKCAYCTTLIDKIYEPKPGPKQNNRIRKQSLEYKNTSKEKKEKHSDSR